MSEEKNKGGRPRGKRYPRRLMIYMTERGVGLLETLARQRDTSLAEVVRQLVREEARRKGLINGKEEEDL